ncbi:anti-sigma factor antagonist [Streptomyces sp. NPDC093591]|uniref:anti-sigma factor antagonist n=1 Tax=Streptomyces sp. NPDC093591 TaxID=3366044 RepID=UPI00382EFE18
MARGKHVAEGARSGGDSSAAPPDHGDGRPAIDVSEISRTERRTIRSSDKKLTIEFEQVSAHMAVLKLAGTLDVYTHRLLREACEKACSDGYWLLVLDLDDLDFLDSTGLGTLVSALKRVRAHRGALSLSLTKDRILKIFRITGLIRVFPTFPSVTEAKDYLFAGNFGR